MTCQQASELLSQQLDGALSLRSKIGLRVHLRCCSDCRHFRLQLVAVENLVAEVLAQPESTAAELTLSNETKAQLRASIRAALERNPHGNG